jgi:hypothetical protein
VTVTADDGKSKVSKKVKLVIVPKNKAPVIEIASSFEAKEGETFTLKPVVTDAENDKVTVKYTGWMTSDTKEIGYDDKGEYKVKISAGDGKQTTSKEVTINVLNTNRAPLLNKVPDVVITEGETAVVAGKAIDADGDPITYSFLGAPLDAAGKWATKVGDAGTYMVKIIATDGTDKDEKSFLIVVKSKNHAPVITPISDILITLDKGQIKDIKLDPKVVDEDGDKITMTYSGWMTTSTKTATYGDAGKHVVTINAYDGRDTATINVNIEINRPPQFVIE